MVDTLIWAMGQSWSTVICNPFRVGMLWHHGASYGRHQCQWHRVGKWSPRALHLLHLLLACRGGDNPTLSTARVFESPIPPSHASILLALSMYSASTSVRHRDDSLRGLSSAMFPGAVTLPENIAEDNARRWLSHGPPRDTAWST